MIEAAFFFAVGYSGLGFSDSTPSPCGGGLGWGLNLLNNSPISASLTIKHPRHRAREVVKRESWKYAVKVLQEE
jgi:hypothetical protein